MTDRPEAYDVSIEISKTENSVVAKVRSRAISAIDRLCGGVFDFVGRPLARDKEIDEARSAAAILEIGARAQARALVIKTAGEKVADSVGTDNILARRIIDAPSLISMEKQGNVESVALEALKELSTQFLNGDVQEQNVDAEIDQEWLNYFRDFAGNASSEKMRNLLGRILAGELVRPGSFSPKTIRTVFEIGQSAAETFRLCAPLRFNDCIPNNIPECGVARLLELEEAGLVNGVSGTLSLVLDTLGEKADDTLYAFGDQYVVLGKGKKSRLALAPRLQCIFLTKSGSELSKLFPADELTAVKFIAESSTFYFEELAIHKLTGKEAIHEAWEVSPVWEFKKPDA